MSSGLRTVPPCVPAGGGRALLLPPVLPSHMDCLLVLHVSQLSDVQVGQIDSLKQYGNLDLDSYVSKLIIMCPTFFLFLSFLEFFSQKNSNLKIVVFYVKFFLKN